MAATEVLEEDDFLVGRRNNPDYSQVTAMVPKGLAKRLKVYCTEAETTITEVVEKLIEEFLNEQEKSKNKKA